MTTVILLRHGRSTANAAGTLAGRLPVDLDEAGVAQARAAGARLAAASLPLAAVVTSPLVRCRRTVELALPGTPVQVDERFTECGYGDWQGRPLRELSRAPLWKVVQTYPSGATFPQGESMAAMSARAVAAIRDWDARIGIDHGPDAVWLVCTHGDIIKALVADALGMHVDLFQRIAVDPGSMTILRYTPLRPFLLRANDLGSDLVMFQPPKRRRRRPVSSDAAVGGGAGVGDGAAADRIGS